MEWKFRSTFKWGGDDIKERSKARDVDVHAAELMARLEILIDFSVLM
jgi:hypothetical protein